MSSVNIVMEEVRVHWKAYSILHKWNAVLRYYDVTIGQGNEFISSVKLNIAGFNCFILNCSIPKPR